ncbi:uncharacterized protein LOC131692901 [Topomyia yanbarensis]|uniref:uncharacterized protein LOC131692901 n=1 Tax=Topomyia yanbarensis TaxID=2498891 RepID=UPI00273BF06A|nr:uncharacterized protein LOC131692901 [Topomyia yanbarensis]
MFKSTINICSSNIHHITLVRNFGKHNKKFLYNDGIKVQNIIYYPRENCPQNIPQTTEPSKLFKVRRIKPLKGCPYWEKRILRDLGLYESNAIAVVKNIPENNARLWKIKHLIEILPIIFSYGEPIESDINYTFLKEDGECVVIKELQKRKLRDNRLEAAINLTKKKETMDGETLRKDSRLKWLNPW